MSECGLSPPLLITSFLMGGKMPDRNSSRVKEFVFTGFTDSPELAATLFALFLVNYLITIVGNLGMLMLIRTDARFHTPMYFFLSNLSFLDICYSTTISPRLLKDLLREKKVITFNECIVQFYFYVTFATTECYLLAAMAYDRYMAICNPLTYTITMSQKVCAFLVAGSYIAGTVNAVIHTGCMTRLSFCGPNVIDHFYCEGPPLFQLSCSDTSLNIFVIMSWKVCSYLVIASFLAGFINAAIHIYFTFHLHFCDSNIINHFFCDTPPLLALSCTDIHINLIIIFVFASFNELSCLITILISYIYILSAILRISSSEGRRRAFSTCASHLLAVTIFFGTILFMYLRPSSSHSMDQDKIVSVFYTVVIPMLNPLIYSLRNREVKDALRKAVRRKAVF
uniref:Olfactory receptor n=1 Tax=Podarcis muralis TaxID=64176 RepID=A0A670HTP3_PODMU